MEKHYYNVKHFDAWYDTDSTSSVIYTTDFGAKGIQYKDSKLDVCLENWYETLKDTEPELYNAIQLTTIYQNMYNGSYLYSKPEDDKYLLYMPLSNGIQEWWIRPDTYTPVLVGDRHVFALDISDALEYFSKRDLGPGDYMEFAGTTDAFYFRSAASTGLAFSRGSAPAIGFNTIHGAGYARPAFYIDLSKAEFTIN